MKCIVKILPFISDSDSNSMHFTDRIGIPVNIPGRCLYMYMLSITYKTVWQTLETVKLGRDGGGGVIKGCYPCNYQYIWSATIKIDTAINCSYISDQLPGMLVNYYLINCVSKLWSVVNVHLNKAVIL